MSQEKKDEGSEKKETRRSSSKSVQRRAILRNNFLRAGYRRTILVTFFSIIANVAGGGLLVWSSLWSAADAYIPLFADSRLLVEPPLNEIYGSESDVLKFADAAVRSMFTYDYKNYIGQFQNTHMYFTESGWGKFADGMKYSGALEMVKKDKMVVSVDIKGAPSVEKTEMFGGKMGWTVKIPNVNVSYEAGTQKGGLIVQPRTVELVVIRVPLKDRPAGYAVGQITEKQE